MQTCESTCHYTVPYMNNMFQNVNMSMVGELVMDSDLENSCQGLADGCVVVHRSSLGIPFMETLGTPCSHGCTDVQVSHRLSGAHARISLRERNQGARNMGDRLLVLLLVHGLCVNSI